MSSSSPPSMQSIMSWDSDQGSEFLTQSEADRKFMKQFKHDKCQFEEDQLNELSQYKGSTGSTASEGECRSSASESLAHCKQSQFGRESIASDQLPMMNSANKNDSQSGLDTHPSYFKDKLQYMNPVQKHQQRRSMIIKQGDWRKAAEFVRLPEINLHGHEPDKIEAYSVWGQLDSLLPSQPLVSKKPESSEVDDYSESSDSLEHEMSKALTPATPVTVRQPYHKYLRAINDSETESSTSSDEMVDQVVDDLMEGMLEELYDELIDIHNPYFELKVVTREVTAGDSLEEVNSLASADESESSDETLDSPIRLDFRRQLTKQIAVEQSKESPLPRTDSEIFFCQKHDNYVQMKEVIYNNSASCNFALHDWASAGADLTTVARSREVCKDCLTKQLMLTVHLLDIQQYSEQCGGAGSPCVDLSGEDSARLPFSIFDNFSKVKSLIAKQAAVRMPIMSGFFLVDGTILDPAKENVQFHQLEVKQQSKIALICQLDTNNTDAILDN